MKFIFLVLCFASFTILCSSTNESENDAAAKLVEDLLGAIWHGDMNEVQSLIDKGVQLNDVNSHPLHDSIALHLVGKFNEEIFKLLVKNGVNLEKVDDSGRTPLFKAVDYDNEGAVEVLLKNGANPNVYSEGNRTSALQAAFSHSPFVQSGEKIIDLLIEYGADVNQTDSDGETLLHKAIIGGHKRAIELLIEKGVDVNAVENRWKMTPLHWIASFDSSSSSHRHENWTEDDYLKFAELLINHGADVFATAQYRGDNKSPFDLTTSKKCKR